MNRKMLIILLFFAVQACLANHAVVASQDSLANHSRLQSDQPLIDSLNDKVESLENDFKLHLMDRELWSQSFDRMTTLFTVFNATILISVGLTFFGVFRYYIRSVQKNLNSKIKELEYKHYLSETQINRTLLAISINAKKYNAILLWATRSILKEAENPKKSNLDIDRIDGDIRIIQLVLNNHEYDIAELDFKQRFEIVDNLEKFLDVTKEWFDDERRNKIKDICATISKEKENKES